MQPVAPDPPKPGTQEQALEAACELALPGHDRHTVDPSDEYVSIGQSAQAADDIAWVALENVPAEQLLHFPDSTYAPAPQLQSESAVLPGSEDAVIGHC